MNKKFLELMLNRLVMGRFRYGPTIKLRAYDYHGDLIGRIDKYYHSGNLELLVDTSNLAMLSWLFPYRPPFVHDLLHDRLVGDIETGPIPDLNKLYWTEWCPEFERLMVAKRSTVIKLRGYRHLLPWITSNEYVLIATLAWCEFDNPTHPEAHWAPVDRG